MELYIGGYAQGKLDYVKEMHDGESLWVVQDEQQLKQFASVGNGRLVIYGAHRIVKWLSEEKTDVIPFFEKIYTQYPDCIVICDEVGNGIVPLTETDREYRDAVGKLLIETAKRADRVERIICGLGQRLK